MTEQRFDRRFLGFGLGFPWVVAFCFAAVALLLRRGVPDPMGLHWADGRADLIVGFSAFVVLCAVTTGVVGSLCGVLAAARSLRRWLRRLFMGLAVALSLFIATVGASLLMGQQGFKTANEGTLDSIVLALGSGAALGLGVMMIFVYQPTLLWTSRDDQALAESQAALTGQQRLSFLITARSSSFVLLLMAMLLLGGLFLIISPWITLVFTVLLLVVMANLCASLKIDGTSSLERFLRIRIAGVLPICAIPLAQIKAVEVVPIELWKLGGPGVRLRYHGISFVARSGYGLRLRLRAGTEVLLGARDQQHAEELAKYLKLSAGADQN